MKECGFTYGYCKPPTECGFTYVSATNWTKPAVVTNSNSDCTTWDNDQKTLCYNCQSCKAGILANLRKDWKKVVVLNIIILVTLIIVYFVGYSAFRNNQEENAFPKWRGRGGYT